MRQRRPCHLFMQSALRQGPRRPGVWLSSEHRVMSRSRPAPPLRLGFPPPQHPEGPPGAERGGGWGVDVIGADAAVSSIMDGDDADGGAERVGRGERNRNRERKERGRETHPVTRACAYTHTRASHCHLGIGRRRCAAHTQAHAHALSSRHTPAGGEAGATHTHQWLFLIFIQA